MWRPPENVEEDPALHNQYRVFDDRVDAGYSLSALLAPLRGGDAVVIAIPAGGVPVARVLAQQLELSFDVLVVSKITLPWNTEAGYGALAADGTLRINETMVRAIGLEQDAVAAGIERTRRKVADREQHYHRLIEAVPLDGKTVILVDDGLASGFTMRVAIASARAQGAARIFVAVPTGLTTTVTALARECDRIYCANIREGPRFAVAEAYRRWRDVEEQEVITLLNQ